MVYTGACLPKSLASRVLNREGGGGCLQFVAFDQFYVHIMVELRQRKINDLVVPLLSLETEDHGKPHTLIRTEAVLVHVGSGGACQGCMNA